MGDNAALCAFCVKDKAGQIDHALWSPFLFFFFLLFFFCFCFWKDILKAKKALLGAACQRRMWSRFSFHVSPTFQNILDWFSKFFHNNHQFTFAFERIRGQRWWLLFIPLPGKHYCCYFFITIKVLLLRISLQFLLLYNDSNKGKSIIKAFPDTKLGSIRHSYFFGYIINKISSYPIETLHPLMGTLHFGFSASYTSF